jgi:hypothetical protein
MSRGGEGNRSMHGQQRLINREFESNADAVIVQVEY